MDGKDGLARSVAIRLLEGVIKWPRLQWAKEKLDLAGVRQRLGGEAAYEEWMRNRYQNLSVSNFVSMWPTPNHMRLTLRILVQYSAMSASFPSLNVQWSSLPSTPSL